MIFACTDYPIIGFGDESGKPAPTRQCCVLSYDGDKYCNVFLADGDRVAIVQIKAGYLYQHHAYLLDVKEHLNREDLEGLPRDFKFIKPH